MTFFDSKEEVLNIELTPYGKYLLSKGQWIPAYYELYDDDVLYDTQYAGYTEKQEATKQRIKQTPRTKVQYTFDSADKRYKKYAKKVEETGDLSELVVEKRNNFSFLSLPLAKSSVLSENAPYSSIKLLNGAIEKTQISSGSYGIPRNTRVLDLQKQNFLLSFREKTANEPEQEPVILEQGNGEEVIPGYQSTTEKIDVTVNDKIYEIAKMDNYLLIDIEEFEVDVEKENFDIFLYEVETKQEAGNTIEVEKQLFFTKKYNNVVNNILVDSQTVRPQTQVNDQFAEYYFDFLTDKQIPVNVLCDHLDEQQIAKLNAEGYNINCEQNRRIRRLENPELNISQEQLDRLQEC
jgi:hypothetical protein